MTDSYPKTPQLNWQAQALWAALDPLLPGLAVEVVARTESTNTALVERSRLTVGQRTPRSTRRDDGSEPAGQGPALGRRSMDSQPCLLVAEEQTRGRGRMGRTWSSTAGRSLTFSLALPLAPVDWSGLSLAVGVALAEALDLQPAPSAARIRLKWPNDLWLWDPRVDQGGRKLGGILIETVPVGGRRMCVVGVGLNVLPQEIDELSAGFACLQELQADVTAPGVLKQIAAPLVRALQAFESGGFAGFAQRYSERDLLAGRRVSTTLSDATSGIAEGVDERGALQLLCDDGRRVLVNSGEISVRPAKAAALTAARPENPA